MTKKTLELILEELELPASAYEKAVSRYEDLGSFLASDSCIKQYEPNVFVQGSFRLGTAIKPLDSSEPYDLDLTCKLTERISKFEISQKDFKNLVGKAIDEYIIMRDIKETKKEKRRCWRIEYQDDINFHMDVVPGIPIKDTSILRESMIKSSISATDAAVWAELAYNITDNKKFDYEIISQDWNISNPEGYAKWFEWRMQLGDDFSGIMLKANYEKLRTFKHKTVLQKCIQILKRHRDIMFKPDPRLKPISIIITTLSGQVYCGERHLEDALINIIDKMVTLIKSNGIRIPNPTRPEEDFADKWKESPGMEEAFYRWYFQVRADLSNIISGTDLYGVINKANSSLGIRLNENMFNDFIVRKDVSIQPHRVEIDSNPPRPHMWI